ncbi:hydrolase [Actinoplanes sp. NBRC 14428]|nr:hydrolase [Actinoplanes sp. NBRC 14428]
MRRLPFFLRVWAGRRRPRGSYEVRRETAVPVPGADGSILLTDHYAPVTDREVPTLLVRSTYGRGFPWNLLYGVRFAEQGFHVVLQSPRGTGGSEGDFHFWRHHAEDGNATVDWLRKQQWFTGALGTAGPSHLAYVQWALALDPPPELRAATMQVPIHDPYDALHPGGQCAFNLELGLVSGAILLNRGAGTAGYTRAVLRLLRHLRRVVRAVPLLDSYRRAFGGRRQEFEDWLTHPYPDDPFWAGADAGAAADRLTAPVALATGWHDLALDQTLRQYARLRRAGRTPGLLIGPWTHSSALEEGWNEVFADAVAHLRAHLGDGPERPGRVRVHIGGEWRELPDWPPPSAPTRYHLGDGGELHAGGPGDDARTTFRYDPRHPTPSLGGQGQSRPGGAVDNRRLEARPDVRTFTTAPLDEAVEVIGHVAADLHVGGSTGHFDVFARLCDVAPDGRSVNVCDGLVRLTPDHHDGDPVRVELSAAGHRFAPGHRIRLQVSGGAHPRRLRNYGTGEPAATATRLVASDTTVHHGRTRPSALVLPVV